MKLFDLTKKVGKIFKTVIVMKKYLCDHGESDEKVGETYSSCEQGSPQSLLTQPRPHIHDRRHKRLHPRKLNQLDEVQTLGQHFTKRDIG